MQDTPNGQFDTPTEGFVAADAYATDGSDEPLVVHGVALPENETATGVAGEPTYYPPETLEAAAAGLEGRKLVDDTDHDDLEAMHPPNSAIIGDVTSTAYKSGVGVVFEGEIDREPERSLVENGRVTVSPALFRRREFDDDREAYRGTEVAHWRDLAVVGSGANDGASIQPGTATALQAEALRATFADGGSETNGDEQQSDEPAESGADVDSDNDQDQDTMTDMDLTDDEEALVHAARSTDDPVVLPAEAQGLAENAQELNITEFDDPTVVESDEFETLNSRVEGVRDVFAEALADRADMKPETAQSLELDALMAEFENDDGEFEADALTQSPEAGGAGDESDGDGGAVQADALSENELSEVRSLAKRAETFDSIDADHADALRDEAADVAGADEFADIELEVL